MGAAESVCTYEVPFAKPQAGGSMKGILHQPVLLKARTAACGPAIDGRCTWPRPNATM